ncbi:hypothetical protein Pmani_018988 [Petrolisthes manimaculis]|uniref:Uncharacterized protein n=1 Tax=Petrolisthes manimaculis TaxID=1843537 RepID=A0AAE1PKG2_9EUCA|nr:hypothetical protein Pmani_018988 [Petrolisthes manimaculis]
MVHWRRRRGRGRRKTSVCTQKRTMKVGNDEVVISGDLNLADLRFMSSARVVIKSLEPSECLQYGVNIDGGDGLDPFPSQTIKDSEIQIQNEEPKVHQSTTVNYCKPPLPLGCIIMFIMANTKSGLLIEQIMEVLKLLFPFFRNSQSLSMTLNKTLTMRNFKQYYSFISRKDEDIVRLNLKKCKETKMKVTSVFDELSAKKRILRDSLSCPDLVDFLLQRKGDLHTWIVDPFDQVKLEKCAEPTKQNNIEVETKPVVKCKSLAITHLEENIAVENMSAAVISQQVVEKLDKTSVQSGIEQSILEVGRKCSVEGSDKTNVLSESEKNIQKVKSKDIVDISDKTSVQTESKKDLQKEGRKDIVEISESKQNMQKDGREGIVRMYETSVQSESKKNLQKVEKNYTLGISNKTSLQSESKQNMQKDGREDIVRIYETSVQSESKKNLQKEGKNDIVDISDKTSVQSESKKDLQKEGRKDIVEISEPKPVVKCKSLAITHLEENIAVENMSAAVISQQVVEKLDKTSVESGSEQSILEVGRKCSVEGSDKTNVLSESEKNMQKVKREDIVGISDKTSVQTESKKNMQKDEREDIVKISDKTSVQSKCKKNLQKVEKNYTLGIPNKTSIQSESKQNMQKDGREDIVRIYETSVQSESKKNLQKEGRKDIVEISKPMPVVNCKSLAITHLEENIAVKNMSTAVVEKLNKTNVQSGSDQSILEVGRKCSVEGSDKTNVLLESEKNIQKVKRKDIVDISDKTSVQTESKKNMQKDGREDIVKISDETCVQSESKKNLQKEGRKDIVEISKPMPVVNCKSLAITHLEENIAVENMSAAVISQQVVEKLDKTSVESGSEQSILEVGRKCSVEGSDKTNVLSESEKNMQKVKRKDIVGISDKTSVQTESKKNMQKNEREDIVKISDKTSVQSKCKKNLQKVEKNYTLGIPNKTSIQSESKQNMQKDGREDIVRIYETSVQSESKKNLQKEGRKDIVEMSDKTSVLTESKKNMQKDGREDIVRIYETSVQSESKKNLQKEGRKDIVEISKPMPVVNCKSLAITHLEENIAVKNMSTAVVEKLNKTSVQSGSDQSILEVGRKCSVEGSDKTNVLLESEKNIQKVKRKDIVDISDKTSVQTESKKNMQKDGREDIVKISDETCVQSESKKNLQKEGRKNIVDISDQTRVQSESKKDLQKEGKKDIVEISESKQNMQKDGREGIVRISDETSVQSESKKNLQNEGRKETVEGSDKTSMQSGSEQNVQSDGGDDIVRKENGLRKIVFHGNQAINSKEQLNTKQSGQSSTSAPLNDKVGVDLPAHYSASNGTSNTVYENINIDNSLPISQHLIGETVAEFGDVDTEISWPVAASQHRVRSMELENLGVENPRSRSPSQLRVPNASEDDVSTVALVNDNITENCYDSDIIITDVKPRAWELWFPSAAHSTFQTGASKSENISNLPVTEQSSGAFTNAPLATSVSSDAITKREKICSLLQVFAKRHDLHWQFSELLRLYKVLFAQPQFPIAKGHYLFSIAACNVCLYNVIDNPLRRSFMLLVQEELKSGSKHTNMVLNKLAFMDYYKGDN